MIEGSEENNFVSLNPRGNFRVKRHRLRHAERFHEANGSSLHDRVVKNRSKRINKAMRVVTVKNTNIDQVVKTFFDSTVESAFRR